MKKATTNFSAAVDNARLTKIPTTMTSVEEVCAQFNAMCEKFEVVESQHTKNYITKIVESADGVLFTIRHGSEKGKENLVGIITANPAYKKKFGRSFRMLSDLWVYDNTLACDKVTVAIRKMEVVWKAKLHD